MAEDLEPDNDVPGPDASLQDWLKSPQSAEFLRQKALEHAQAFTEPDVGPQPPPGYAMPDRSVQPAPSLRSDDDGTGTPNQGPLGNIGVALGLRDPKTGKVLEGSPDPTRAQGPYVMNKGPGTDAPPPTPFYPTPDGKPIPGADLDPEEASTPVPLPRERPKEASPGASDLSAQARQKKSEALDSAMKSFSGIKAPTPPPLNPVGTPSVRSPGAVSAPNIANLLALTQGAQPNPLLQTLGKLLVAGKA